MIKKIIFYTTFVILTAALVCACTQKKEIAEKETIKWEGEYYGTIPAADCPGINVTLILNADFSYELTNEYIDRDYTVTYGNTFTLNDADTIILPGEDNPGLYKIGDGFLKQLDIDGNEIEGEFADMYVLMKR